MKNKLLLYLFFQLVASALTAQADTTYYYDAWGRDCVKDSAKWYREVHFINAAKGECEATDYYPDKVIARSKGPYIRDNTGVYPNGMFTNYHDNGKKETEGAYVCDLDKGIKGKRTGKWIEFNDQGKPEWEYRYDGLDKDGNNTQLVISYWDSTGKQLLSNGNGPVTYNSRRTPPNDTTLDVIVSSVYKNGRLDGKHLITFLATGKTFADEEYNGGELVRGTSYDKEGAKYTYAKLEENPEYPGGDEAVIDFLKKHIKYPKYERNHDIEGRVLLRFVVDKDGSVTDVSVIRSVSEGLDNEALRVTKILPKFKPGKHKGQPVRVYFNLPIVFKLE